MAKYTVTHNCGHTETHDLFGPGKERERKIAWLETTDCKDCWLKSQRAERDAAPVTAEIICNMFTGDGKSVYIAVTGGNIYPIKDALKSAGCRWMEYHDNNDLLGTKSSRKAWMIKIDPNNTDTTTATIQRLMDAGVTAINDTLNPLGVTIVNHLAGDK